MASKNSMSSFSSLDSPSGVLSEPSVETRFDGLMFLQVIFKDSVCLVTCELCSHGCVCWAIPSTLFPNYYAVWLAAQWSPPDGGAVPAHTAAHAAIADCALPLDPQSPDRPDTKRLG